ncbi:MAG: hypothetical protein DMD82_09440 [Candidatus Rokuibacteriota bacterium]|nr:MAG: hypothetical protein DMD82_09440 [Candidatus Rokubacteria bacterium]
MSFRIAPVAVLSAVLAVVPCTGRADPPPRGSPFSEWFKSVQVKSGPSSGELPHTLDGAVSGYLDGRVADAEAVVKSLATEKPKDESYPLYQLTLGSISLCQGDYQAVQRSLTAALERMGAKLSTTATGLAFINAETKRPYRGFPYEKMLAHTYLGLAFMQQSRSEDARIEFAQAREAQRGSAAGQEDDFATGHFLEGLNFLHRKEYNDAQVSFRKVTELHKEWPLGWFALCRASDLAHDAGEAGEAWSHYEALAPAGARLARDGSTPCVLFLVESGRGPHRWASGHDAQGARDPKAGASNSNDNSKVDLTLAEWKPTDSPEIRVSIACSDTAKVEAPKLDDLYFQASTSGGIVGEATRKLVGGLIHSFFSGDKSSKDGSKNNDKNKDQSKDQNKDDENVDLRSWGTTPGALHLAAVPVPAVPTTIETTCSDKSGNNIESLRRVMRFLRGQPFERAPIVYERIPPNAASRAGG